MNRCLRRRSAGCQTCCVAGFQACVPWPFVAGGQIFSRLSRRGFSPHHLPSFQPAVHGKFPCPPDLLTAHEPFCLRRRGAGCQTGLPWLGTAGSHVSNPRFMERVLAQRLPSSAASAGRASAPRLRVLAPSRCQEPVRGKLPKQGTGGETPPELAGGDACATSVAGSALTRSGYSRSSISAAGHFPVVAAEWIIKNLCHFLQFASKHQRISFALWGFRGKPRCPKRP